MREIKISKRNGSTRTIVVPGRRLKKRLRDQISELQRLLSIVGDMNVIHGFAEMRSPVTNAMQHTGKRYTLSFDLKDFFDSVKCDTHGKWIWERINRNKINIHHASFSAMFYKGRAAQGLPTSPIVANLAAVEFDARIVSALSVGNGQIFYTRYADDLSFSFNEPWLVPQITEVVTHACSTHGFEINPAKTQLQCSDSGRRMITGVAVDREIHAPRAIKRKLRAALHNHKQIQCKEFPRRQWTAYKKRCAHKGVTPISKERWLRFWLLKRVRGLREWSELRLPSIGRRSMMRITANTKCPSTNLQRLASRMPAGGTP